MKNLKLVPSLVLVGIFFVAGCAKEKWEIGKDEPQIEIQKCLKLSEKKDFEEAIECLEIFKSRFPQSAVSAEAELAIGDNYFNKKEYLLAADAYLMFAKMHPTHPKSDYAYYRLGLSYLKETPKPIDRDQQYLEKAIYYLRLAVQSFPSSSYHAAAVESLKDARNRVAKRNYYIGRFYYRTGEYFAAIPRFLDIVNDYPETDVVPISLYKLVVATGKLKNTNDAKLFFSKLEMEHPQNKWTKKAEGKLKSYIRRYGEGEGTPEAQITPDNKTTEGGTK